MPTQVPPWSSLVNVTFRSYFASFDMSLVGFGVENYEIFEYAEKVWGRILSILDDLSLLEEEEDSPSPMFELP